MKKIAAALVMFANACAVGADQPDNGFYLRTDGVPASRILTQDGQKLFLGARQDLKVLRGDLFSQDNANTRFYLSVTVPYDKSIGPATYLLCVNGTVYSQTGSGASHEETSSLSFYISRGPGRSPSTVLRLFCGAGESPSSARRVGCSFERSREGSRPAKTFRRSTPAKRLDFASGARRLNCWASILGSLACGAT